MEMQQMSTSAAGGNDNVTYNVLLGDKAPAEEEYFDDDIEDEHVHEKAKLLPKSKVESFEFTTLESATWRKHKVRRYFQDRGKFWTAKKTGNAYKWMLILLAGVLIGATGVFVSWFVNLMCDWKLNIVYGLMAQDRVAAAFFSYQFVSSFLVIISALLCVWQPDAAGSGIPEIIAFLNGVSYRGVVKFKVLVAKVIAMCLSVSAGLPLGKEGPMIHAGAIIGALVSQGYTLSLGFDTSWKRFQDLRNDENQRDFVTYGAAAGISGAFRAPIGGILFALEEGASYWSTSVTLRAFMCACATQFTVSIIMAEKATSQSEMFAFGNFSNFLDGTTNYHMYEIPIFCLMGMFGGVLGAFFNYMNKHMTLFRMNVLRGVWWKRVLEAMAITFLMSFIGFILSICWQKCTPLPAITDDTTDQEAELIGDLVQFQCPDGYYNQLASLHMVTGDMATRQLFHFREFHGQGQTSFSYGALILFFIPYYVLASITAGLIVPAGLFVPTLLAGASYGRMVGHFMNLTFPVGTVADSGTYALVGAAAMLGGMARMTIAGTVICLEACGNMAYLLPLMVTFTGARYAGNAIGVNFYEQAIHLRNLPFIEGSLHSLGLLNYQNVTSIMTAPVVTLKEVERVSHIMHILTTTTHCGFPVVNEEGQLRGIVLRRTLCSLLMFKAYSVPTGHVSKDGSGKIEVIPASTVAYDTLERTYPNYADVSSVKLTETEMTYWLDMRPYMDPSPYLVNQNTTVVRTFQLFRTMGLRHLPVVDGNMHVQGIITRVNLTEHNLHHVWEHEGEHMIKSMNVEISESTYVTPSAGAGVRGIGASSHGGPLGASVHGDARRSSNAEYNPLITDVSSGMTGGRGRSNSADAGDASTRVRSGSIDMDEEVARARMFGDEDAPKRVLPKSTD